MNEMDPLEKQLRSWTPRRPSPKIAERLFGTKRCAPAAHAHLWNWLTPVAACALTVMVVVRGSMRHSADFDPATNSPGFATVMYDPQASNAQRTFVLSHSDLNMGTMSGRILARGIPPFACRAFGQRPTPPPPASSCEVSSQGADCARFPLCAPDA